MLIFIKYQGIGMITSGLLNNEVLAHKSQIDQVMSLFGKSGFGLFNNKIEKLVIIIVN